MSTSSQRTIVVVAVGARFEGDQPVAAERPVVADREARAAARSSVIVTGSVTVIPNIRTSASPRVPTPIGPCGQHPHRLHVVHPARLALDIGDDGPDALDRRVDDDQRARSASGCVALRLLGAGRDRGRSRCRPRRAPAGRPRGSPHHRRAQIADAGGRASRRAPARRRRARGRPAAMASARTVGLEAEPTRIERGRLDAVVGREADHDDPCSTPASRRRPRARSAIVSPVDRVAHREAGVAVLAVGALADARRVIGQRQRRDGARRPTCPATQWTGQMPPSLAKWGVARGCQSWVATTRAPLAVGQRDLAVDHAGRSSSPPATLRLPAGSAKSFWTSTTIERRRPGP